MLPGKTRGKAVKLNRRSEPLLLIWLSGTAFLEISRLRSYPQQVGGLAQLGEHDVRNVGVAGSTPVPSTNKIYLRQIPSFMYQSRTWASAVLLDDLS